MFDYLNLPKHSRTNLCQTMQKLNISYSYKKAKLNNTNRLYLIADITEKHILKAISIIEKMPKVGKAKRKNGVCDMCLMLVHRQRIDTLKAYLKQ